jgi:hypothetical protein
MSAPTSSFAIDRIHHGPIGHFTCGGESPRNCTSIPSSAIAHKRLRFKPLLAQSSVFSPILTWKSHPRPSYPVVSSSPTLLPQGAAPTPPTSLAHALHRFTLPCLLLENKIVAQSIQLRAAQKKSQIIPQTNIYTLTSLTQTPSIGSYPAYQRVLMMYDLFTILIIFTIFTEIVSSQPTNLGASPRPAARKWQEQKPHPRQVARHS